MTFAHIPAGYITCRLLAEACGPRIRSEKAYLSWGLFGAVAPDLDYLYLAVTGNLQVNHHLCFTHFLLVWVALFMASSVWMYRDRTGQPPLSAFMFSLGGLVHIFLDTISGRVFWLAPFSYETFSGDNLLFSIATEFAQTHRHWGYGVELLIIIWAAILFANTGRVNRRHSGLGTAVGERHSA